MGIKNKNNKRNKITTTKGQTELRTFDYNQNKSFMFNKAYYRKF